VLWLLEGSAQAPDNLRRQAQARGIDPARLVFAPKLAMARHLASHRLADLLLDTLPYNAHTTASDALWAGLPVLTRIGTSFAGRVAASLVRASGLHELVVDSEDAYRETAIALARDPGRLAALKEMLSATRMHFPLFETARFTRHFEAGLTAMVERRRAGLSPDHIVVAPEPG